MSTSILRACLNHVCFAIIPREAVSIFGLRGFTRGRISARFACGVEMARKSFFPTHSKPSNPSAAHATTDG